MTKRDQLRGLLGSLNPGNAGGGEHVAFRDLFFRDQVERLALEPDLATGNSYSLAQRLCRNINHLDATIRTDVTESFHFRHSERSEAKSRNPAAARTLTQRGVSTSLDMTRIVHPPMAIILRFGW